MTPKNRKRLILLAPLAISLLSTGGWAEEGAATGPEPEPTVVVQVKFVPGGRQPWTRAFETHIVPAVRAAMAEGELRDFAYFEAIVPGQDYDFMLELRADSFAFFDRRRPYPHWAALFQRVGVEKGRHILSEMLQWEAETAVYLVRAYRGGR